MDLKEGREKFIQSWGTLGSHWGINRTMAQIHALLLVSDEPMSANDIKDDLNISMGNVNMNIRALMDWGLVYKKLKSGERKDFYEAEKDMWKVVKCIVTQRKKKELEPMIRVLNEISQVKGEDKETQEFKKVIQEIKLFSSKADTALDNFMKSDSNWVLKTFFNVMK